MGEFIIEGFLLPWGWLKIICDGLDPNCWGLTVPETFLTWWFKAMGWLTKVDGLAICWGEGRFNLWGGIMFCGKDGGKGRWVLMTYPWLFMITGCLVTLGGWTMIGRIWWGFWRWKTPWLFTWVTEMVWLFILALNCTILFPCCCTCKIVGWIVWFWLLITTGIGWEIGWLLGQITY